MRVLALEPYYGGSHRRFVDGWIARSMHAWDLRPLPARKWKWRMRHSAVTYAEEVEAAVAEGAAWDVVWCSDMVNLAEFRALAPPAVGRLPAVAYFHENQLTYPVRFPKERDYQFGMTNITSALAAREVWFNSAFHRDEFLEAIPRFLKVMPDHQPIAVAEKIERRARVLHPPIDGVERRAGQRRPGPLRIVWAARWEFDKAPEVLFEALDRLLAQGVDFHVSVLGEQFDEAPEVFAQARERLGGRVAAWGFLPARADYLAALHEADVFVSTAIHEFFGLAAVEAMAAGARPLLPRALAYPEVLQLADHPEREAFFYDGGSVELAGRLAELAAAPDQATAGVPALRPRMESFFWADAAPQLDEALRVAAR